MQKIILLTSCFLGAFSVIIGAFGAHAFRNFLETTNRVATFETAVKYQFYHTLMLLAVGIIMYNIESKLLNYAAISLVAGIFVFSGSLYLLCFTGITKWGAITPIGGLFLIGGWVFLFLAILKNYQA
ncbi:MAG: DUF423 domain-containing protein [Bacteroidota bacterium]|nr:DUF423 domain-containing protein [Bacteroidota bacterium]